MEWIKILNNYRNLNINSEEIEPIKENIYLVDTSSEDDSEEQYIVFNCCKRKLDFNYENFKKIEELLEKYITYQPAIIFENWTIEKDKYFEVLNNFGRADDKKKFREWFYKNIFLYSEIEEEISLCINGSGINYLEYPEKTENNELKGFIYNISFNELRKLFNITGNQLFKNNVRYGLSNNKIKDQLKINFKEHLQKVAIKKLKQYELDELEEIVDFFQISGEKLKNETTANSDSFWFYHNGITIFSNEKIKTPENKIILKPKNVSVINGAQTMTNFFEIAYELEKILKNPKLKEKLSEISDEILNDILNDICVKTIIIQGQEKDVKSITYGLNTQIPIEEKSILADSDDVERINHYFKGKIKILKDGEIGFSGIGYSTLDFAKIWMIIDKRPGKSKNYNRNDLYELLEEIAEKFEVEKKVDEYIENIKLLEMVNKWWEATKKARKIKEEKNKNVRAINSYGKNYFGSFVLKFIEDNKISGGEELVLGDELLDAVYDKFTEILMDKKEDLSVGDFKKDELSNKILLERLSIKTKKELSLTEKELNELKNELNDLTQSQYTFSQTIGKYLSLKKLGEDEKLKIPYFRVISFEKDKVKEAYPFPNSTFNELIESNDGVYKKYDESLLSKEIKKEFPVFVIYKDSDNKIEDIKYIPKLTFKEYDNDAKEVYDKTVEVFKEGDESKFTKTSEDLKFHIRSKAQTANDTFEFTNGNYITKRTFWANKDTVEKLVNKCLSSNIDTDE